MQLGEKVYGNPKRLGLLFVSLGFFVLAVSLFAFNKFSVQPVRAAQAPDIITYQGKILSNNLAVTTTVSMIISVYDALSGGSVVYTASGTIGTPVAISVTPTNGIFTVNFGGSGTNSLDPTIFQNNQSLYLQVIVGGETLAPRKQLTASPYAYNAKFLDGVAATSTASSSTYIPISDSTGNFNFNRVTSTGLTVTGTSTLVTTTFSKYIGIGTTTPQEKTHLVNGTLLIDNPVNPTLKGAYGTTNAFGVYVSGKYAYVADGGGGLKIIDISNPAFPTLIGTDGTFSLDAYNVFVSGKYAYVVETGWEFEIFDISNPANPTLTGSYAAGGFGVYVSGKYAYVAGGPSGLQIIDISNPANPTLAGNYTFFPYDANGVYVSGKYAYVANGGGGLKIIDISNPASPTLISTLDTTGSALNVYVSGKYAYVADSSSGLQIINISNPASPILAGTLGTTEARGVYVSGKYAYVADLYSGLRIIDISSSTNPMLTGTYDTTGSAYNVYVSGKYAYVADDSNGLQIIDIYGADIHAASIGNISTNDLTVWENIDIGNSLSVRNSLNVGVGGILSNGSLNVSATSSTSTILGSFMVSGGTTLGNVTTTNLYVSGITNLAGTTITNVTSTNFFTSLLQFTDLLGINATTTNLNVSGLTNLGSTIITNVTSTNVAVTGLFDVSGTSTLATTTFNKYVGIGTTTPQEKVHIYNGSLLVDNPINPTIKGVYDTPSTSFDVYVSGKYAYVADGSSGLQIIDISNSASPTTIGTYDTTGQAYSVHVSGRYAYVADGISQLLLILDISNPASPILIGSFNLGGIANANGIYVSGKYAYVANSNNGLKIIDISNPASPTLVSTNNSSNAQDVYVSGKYAYVADYAGGLKIIDISNPASPTTTGSYDTAGLAFDVYVSGRYAYVGDGGSGLQIIDVSNPASSTLTGNYDTANIALGIYVSGKYAYVSDGTSGLLIVDVSNPAAPELVGSYNTSGNAAKTHVSGRYAYIADGTSGLQIIDIYGADIHAANIGNIATNDLTVWENIDIGNSLSVRNGLNVGIGGIMADGPLNVTGTSSFMAYVGIGTTTPQAPLHIVGTIGTTSSPVVIVDKISATGTLMSFRQNSVEQGTITVSDDGVVSYNAFTGSHYAVLPPGVTDMTRGTLVSLSGLNEFLNDNSEAEIIYGVTSTAEVNDPHVLGSYLALQNPGSYSKMNPYLVMAVGNGDMLVTDGGSNIAAGDFLISSAVSGHGMKDTGTFDQSYIVARAAEAVNWSSVTSTLDGVKHKRISVFYESFVKDNRFGKTFIVSSTAATMTLGGASVLSVLANGDVLTNGTVKAASFETGPNNLDLAEIYPIQASCERDDSCPEPGDAVCLVDGQQSTIEKCTLPYSEKAIGIISTNPGFTLGGRGNDQERKVALAGRVPLKVSSKNGSIRVGDKLTTSDVPGVAMKAVDSGPTIGVALEDFYSELGSTQVFVKMGWWAPLTFSSPVATSTLSAASIMETVIEGLKNLGITIAQGVIKATEFIADKVTSGEVKTQKLCVDDTCITQSQFKALLEKNNISPESQPMAALSTTTTVSSVDVVSTSTTLITTETTNTTSGTDMVVSTTTATTAVVSSTELVTTETSNDTNSSTTELNTSTDTTSSDTEITSSATSETTTTEPEPAPITLEPVVIDPAPTETASVSTDESTPIDQ